MGILIKDIQAILPGSDGALDSRRTSVYVEGGVIASIGAPEVSAEKTIDGVGRLLTPGMVNAHTHAYMTALRNLADDLGFDDWLFGSVMPAENSLTADDAYWSSALACMEMLKSGVTTFLDMHMFPGASVRAAQETGMRAVISRGLSGGADDAEGGERRLREARDEIEAYGNLERLSFMAAPHAIYTCDEGFMREIAAFAREYGLGIHTHLNESRGEVEGCEQRYGCSPIELYERCGLFGGVTVAAHCVHLSGGDIEILRRNGVAVALNLASNLKLANGFAPVPALMAAGIELCLGTDGAASNNSLSILRELSLLTLVYKGIMGDPLAVSAREAFAMATLGGARALGLGDITGTIEVGKRADLAIWRLDEPGRIPAGDPFSTLCYSGAGLAADTVMADGRIVLENGEFTGIDAERVYYEVRKTRERLTK